MPAHARLSLAAALAALLLSPLAGCDGAAAPGDQVAVRYAVEGAPAEIVFAGAGGPAAATSGGAWEHRATVERGATLALQATSTSGAPVTARIFVEDRLFRGERGLAVNLTGSTSGYRGGEAEVHGFIEAMGADRVTVLGLVFVITSATRLEDRSGQAVPLSAFREGDYVEAEGRAAGDGTFVAEKLEMDDDEGGEFETEGPIQALTASSVTVNGAVFTVTAATRVLDDDNDPIAFASLAVGEVVEAEGVPAGDGTYRATKIKRDDD